MTPEERASLRRRAEGYVQCELDCGLVIAALDALDAADVALAKATRDATHALAACGNAAEQIETLKQQHDEEIGNWRYKAEVLQNSLDMMERLRDEARESEKDARDLCNEVHLAPLAELLADPAFAALVADPDCEDCIDHVKAIRSLVDEVRRLTVEREAGA